MQVTPGDIDQEYGRKYRPAWFRNVARHYAKVVWARLPGSMKAPTVRRRHIRHVTEQMSTWIHPAYLGDQSYSCDWLKNADERPRGWPEVPSAVLDSATWGEGERAIAQEWLVAGPWDSDEFLEARLDNHDDELGRTVAALRLRSTLASIRRERTRKADNPSRGSRIAIDARSLQSTAYGTRGIGRFAASVVLAARATAGDDRVTLIVDRGLDPLPEAISGTCQQVSRIRNAGEFALLLQPSPMTHSPRPLIPFLASSCDSWALVFDFIPLHYPSVYANNPAARAEYAAMLEALRLYRHFSAISHVVADEVSRVLPLSDSEGEEVSVVWPDAFQQGHGADSIESQRHGPIVVMTGDEPRKNTFGGLAGVAAATSEQASRDVVVLGMAGQGVRVHHWSIAAAMRPGEAVTAERISDAEMTKLLSSARCVVVPSFDEGLSLPVIEAVQAGAPVVASDIPAHVELIGRGDFLADPTSPADMCRAIRTVLRRPETCLGQRSMLERHSHGSLEQHVSALVNSRPEHSQSDAHTHRSAEHPAAGDRLRIALATPWAPQASGVADFSTTIGIELARVCDVTVFTTSDARVQESLPAGIEADHRNVDELIADPDQADNFDAVIAVVGNSHFHLPFVQLTEVIDAIVVAHDTRMVEFYLSLRDRHGVQEVMLRGPGSAQGGLKPALDDQIADMRLLQNTAFWEIAHRSARLVIHSPVSAPRIELETAVAPVVLPFANQRIPEATGDDVRLKARSRLGFDRWSPDAVHLASFGFVDIRTKRSDLVVEAAAWLAQWGRKVVVHLVGSANAELERELRDRARDSDIADIHVTGFVDEQTFRDYLCAVDAGVQLRISPLLGVSGPLSDLSAFGTPAVASEGLCRDVGAPGYITPVPEMASPVQIAEALETCIDNPWPVDAREAARQTYLAAMSPAGYVQQLLDVVRGNR